VVNVVHCREGDPSAPGRRDLNRTARVVPQKPYSCSRHWRFPWPGLVRHRSPGSTGSPWPAVPRRLFQRPGESLVLAALENT